GWSVDAPKSLPCTESPTGLWGVCRMMDSCPARPASEGQLCCFLDFKQSVVLRQPLGMSNRSVLELIDLPTDCQISCPIVLCLSAANAESDGPTRRACLPVRFKRFGECPNLVDLQQQSVTSIHFGCTPYAVRVGAQEIVA